MADNHIRFHIGSTFSGEGFKKAQAAVKEVNGDVKRANSAAVKMSNALGQMDTSASKAAGALTGLISAVMAGGVAGGILAVGIMVINKYIDDANKKMDDLKKRANELHASMEKAFSSALNERMSSIKKEVSGVVEEFDKITKQANQFAAALEGVRSAEASGGIINLQVEKLNALLAAHSEEERANIEAAYNLKIAIQKSADSEIAWQQKTEAAHQAVVDSENRKAMFEKQLAAVEEERASLEATMATAKASDDSHYVEIQKKVNSLKEQEAALSQKILDTESETDVLRVNEQQVKQEAINAQGQATIEVRNAELAEQKLTEAKHNRTVKEEAARDAAEEKAAADFKDSLETKTAAQIQADVNKAAKDLEAAERDYASALNAYAANFSKWNMEADIANGTIRTAAADRASGESAGDAAVRAAIANGVRDSRTLDDIRKRAERADRDRRNSSEANQMKRDDRERERLENMNPKAMTERQKKRLKELQDLKEAREGDIKKKADEEKKLADKQKALDQMPKDVAEILKLMKKLGLT